MFDPIKLHQDLLTTYSFLAGKKATGLGVVRCRTGVCGDLFAYAVKHQDGCTQPRFVKRWGAIDGYVDYLEPIKGDVFGFSLNGYVLQAFKGLRESKSMLPWDISFELQAQILAHGMCQTLDEMELDRLYLRSFENEEAGDGFAYCLKRLTGEPQQFERQFMGEVVYKAGIVRIEDGITDICAGLWEDDHLRSLDDCLLLKGISPTVGFAGGHTPTKSPFREKLRRGFDGVTSIYWC